MAEAKNHLSHYGSIAGSVVAILGLLWLLGEPHLKNYIIENIEVYDKAEKDEDSKKVKLRKLLSEKMDIDEDEVHIELSKLYKEERRMTHKIDSLSNKIKYLEGEIKLNLNSLQMNYSDIKEINAKLSKHGLFH
jgi:hypothetical protein